MAAGLPLAPSASRQTAVVTRTGAPAVQSKELQSVVLLQQRRGFSRLDLGPFFVAYTSVTASLLYQAYSGEWHTFTLLSYGLLASALAHILLLLFTVWNINVKATVAYFTVRQLEQAQHIKVLPAKFMGNAEVVPLVRRVLSDGDAQRLEVSFEFRKHRFIFNPDTHAFEQLRYPVKEPFEYYAKASGYGTPEKVAAGIEQWGLNEFEVPLPPFMELLKEQMLAPFFCFQVFCVALWCIDEYWYYSIFTLFMLVAFESTVVHQRLRNLKELRALQTPKQKLAVYRAGKWETVPGEALLPGDIISIGRPSGTAAEDKVVPADCLLLAGNCIVEEAVLTGESTPQWKVPITDCDPAAHLNIKTDKAHILFGGTKVLQHTGDKAARIRTPDGGCLAVVLRTGFETSQGRLMRTILHSTERITANSWETGLFIAFLLVFAVTAAYYVLTNGLADPKRDRFKLVLNCVMIITSVVPPELPMELTIAVNASLVALARRRVFCTEPFRIPYAGKVEVCCFDKTGTLTTDHLLLEGIAPLEALEAPAEPAATASTAAGAAAAGAGAVVAAGAAASRGTGSKKSSRAKGSSKIDAEDSGMAANGTAGGHSGMLAVQSASDLVQYEDGLVTDMGALPAAVSEVLATCHALVQVEQELIGDPLEKTAIQASRWTYASDIALSPDRKVRATILTRYHFSSSLKRMAALVRMDDDNATGPRHVAVVKGAPEVVRSLLATVPQRYEETYKRYAAQGARVIALARKRIANDLDAGALRQLPRDEVESGLDFVGFAVFQCPLKVESEPTLSALSSSSHQLMMITGDAPLTACYAASQVHIVTRPVLIMQHRLAAGEVPSAAQLAARRAAKQYTDSEYEWVSPDESVVIGFSHQWEELLTLAAEYDLCLTGDALSYVASAGLGPALIPLCQVFARVSPEQKELVVVTLRAAGRCVLMCGDGTNDVGGLKAAHVGVALLAPSEQAEKMRKAREKADKKERAGAKGSSAAGAAGAARGAGRAGGSAEASQQVAAPAPRAKKAPGAGALKKPGTAMIEDLVRAGKPVPPGVQRMADWLDKMESEANTGEVPMLKPGDASMASPFTAKAASVGPIVDIIKQGRCTLVTTVQMFKILGLLCLSTAYSLSVMYLQGVKLSDTQATLSGVLTAGMFFFISSAKPLEKLSADRPHPSIFSFYFFGSLIGQFAAHLAFIAFMYRAAVRAMPADQVQESDSAFAPNLVNSMCYLVEQTIQLSTFAVNYVGHPWNTSLWENVGMRQSLMYAGGFLTILLLQVVPGLNESFQLVPIPLLLRLQLGAWAAAVVFGTMGWEHLLRRLFAAPMPPQKGYMAHQKELQRLQQGSVRTKKQQ